MILPQNTQLRRQRQITTKKKLSFSMCGTRVGAGADIAVMDDAEYLLMVQKDKRTIIGR